MISTWPIRWTIKWIQILLDHTVVNRTGLLKLSLGPNNNNLLVHTPRRFDLLQQALWLVLTSGTFKLIIYCWCKINCPPPPPRLAWNRASYPKKALWWGGRGEGVIDNIWGASTSESLNLCAKSFELGFVRYCAVSSKVRITLSTKIRWKTMHTSNLNCIKRNSFHALRYSV